MVVASDGNYREIYPIYEIYDNAFAVDMKIGIGFRSSPGNVVQLYGGLGLHVIISYFSAAYDSGFLLLTETDIAMGIGLELGAKFNFNESVSLLLGSGAALDLAAHYSISARSGYQTGTESDWIPGYLGFDISPKICMNFQW